MPTITISDLDRFLNLTGDNANVDLDEGSVEVTAERLAYDATLNSQLFEYIFSVDDDGEGEGSFTTLTGEADTLEVVAQPDGPKVFEATDLELNIAAYFGAGSDTNAEVFAGEDTISFERGVTEIPLELALRTLSGQGGVLDVIEGSGSETLMVEGNREDFLISKIDNDGEDPSSPCAPATA